MRKIFTNKYKREIIVLFVFYTLTLLLGFSFYKNLPLVNYYQLSGKILNINNNLLDIVGYDVIDNLYIPNDNDPQLLYKFNNDFISLIKIELSQPILNDTHLQVFYDIENKLSETNSKNIIINKGESNIYVKIPDNYYNIIRIDINGTVKLKNILISDECINGKEKLKYDEHIKYLLFINILLTIIVILLVKYNKMINIYLYFLDLIRLIKENKRLIFQVLIFIIFISLSSFVIEIILSKYIFSSYFIWQRFLFNLITQLSILFIVLFKGKPEKIFLSISLLIGTLYTISIPISETSWDDLTHYNWSIQKSSIKNIYLTEADNIHSIPKDIYYNKELRKIALEEKNIKDKYVENIISINKIFGYSLIGHIPSGIGIFISRSLGLPWNIKFFIGRFMNILMYSLIIYFAIERITYGKYIIASVALTPTIFYLASNYSYDPWVFAWIIFGFSYFIYELQNHEKKIELKNIIIMFIAFILALGPKAVYFPLLLILFFIKKDKFKNKMQFKKYKKAITIILILIILSFMLPFVSSGGGGAGDLRGGADVSGSSQTKFIFNNPIEYTKILIKFIFRYVNLNNSANFLTFFAYLGFSKIINAFIILLFIIIVAFTDENKINPYNNYKSKSILLFSIFSSIVLICTALYISFTPVGLNTINGVSHRYLLPFICPLLLLIRKGDIPKSENINRYSIIVFLFSAYFLLAGLWDVCISKYN